MTADTIANRVSHQPTQAQLDRFAQRARWHLLRDGRVRVRWQVVVSWTMLLCLAVIGLIGREGIMLDPYRRDILAPLFMLGALALGVWAGFILWDRRFLAPEKTQGVAGPGLFGAGFVAGIAVAWTALALGIPALSMSVLPSEPAQIKTRLSYLEKTHRHGPCANKMTLTIGRTSHVIPDFGRFPTATALCLNDDYGLPVSTRSVKRRIGTVTLSGDRNGIAFHVNAITAS